MRLIIILASIIVLSLLFACNIEENENVNVALPQGCVQFETSELGIIEQENEFAITDYDDFVVYFEFQEEAELALEIIEFYHFDQYCTVGEEISFAYFLVEGDIPKGDFPGDTDCLPHNVDNLEVQLTSAGKYTVIEPTAAGQRWLYAGESKNEANEILGIIQQYQSSFGCYVGRPYTKMHYLRK